MQFLDQLSAATSSVPDSVKVASATTPTVMTIAGIPVEQWMFVASLIVSVMFIIEKLPVLITRVKQFINWINSVKRKKSKEPPRS